jgi:hypothetical protein
MRPVASCADTLDPQNVLSAAKNKKKINFLAKQLKKSSRRTNSETPDGNPGQAPPVNQRN